MNGFPEALLRSWVTLAAWLSPRERDERGDVPGWVMITVMTAGLVVVITAVAQGQLSQMVTNALNRVK